jgi:hypothetical protein
MTPRRGFFVSDAVVGLGILAAVALGVAAASRSAGVAATRLADQRSAVRLAENVLVVLQSGEAIDDAWQERITLRPLPDAPPVGQRVWIEVQAKVGHATASLAGLVDRTVVEAIDAEERP